MELSTSGLERREKRDEINAARGSEKSEKLRN